jgi:hypothetical protein
VVHEYANFVPALEKLPAARQEQLAGTRGPPKAAGSPVTNPVSTRQFDSWNEQNSDVAHTGIRHGQV